MNARQLELFRTILRDGTLTAAAASLNISQPAASKQLQHLEDQLGYRLFERIAGRLVPTPEAHLLADDAARVFREIEVLRDLARRVGERKLGLLRIGASLPVVWSILPPALLAFRTAHPSVKVHLHSLPAREIADGLRVGDIDLGLTLSPILAPTIRSEPLAPVELAVLLPEGHPLAARASLGPADLAPYPLISYGSHAVIGPALEEAYREAGLVRDVALQVATSVVAAPLVAAGLGVALVDGLADFPGLIRRPFRPRVTMSLTASTDSARPISRLARPFLALLRARL